jgi:hypothetical protein
MLVRDDDLVISQPAHAWISGQLARAWADELTPRETVCLAAEQHDVGWVDADLEPVVDPGTGRPRPFTALPLPAHLAIWRDAAPRMLAQSRYAALLVSLHGTSLYERRRGTPEVDDHLAGQAELQRELAAGLDPAEVDRNRRLLLAWDHLSLALCLGWSPTEVRDVPSLGDLTLTVDPPVAGSAPARTAARLSPWPFADEPVVLTTEARRLPGRFSDDASLRAALRRAPWVALEFELRPG